MTNKKLVEQCEVVSSELRKNANNEYFIVLTLRFADLTVEEICLTLSNAYRVQNDINGLLPITHQKRSNHSGLAPFMRKRNK